MARVVCVHGIGQQFGGADSQLARWLTPLNDGLRLAGTGPLSGDDVACVFYGDVFRPAGKRLGAQDPPWGIGDVDEFEAELLLAWWTEAARRDEAVVAPDARTLVATPRSVQRGLNALSRSKFFAALAMRAMIADLKQVRAYLGDASVRERVQERFAAAIAPETRVVIGHSLGSVVAYEGLAARGDLDVKALVTLGSPLSVRNLVFERLLPPGGVWPGGVGSWTNIADEGDVVAMVKDLRPRFGANVACFTVKNGSHAHDVVRYLTAVETGRAVADGLESG